MVLFGEKRTQDEDGPPRAHFPDVGRLLGIGHGKSVRAGLHEPGRGVVNAMPVRIGFHDRYQTDSRRQGFPDQSKVAFESGQVNFGPATHSFHDVTRGKTFILSLPGTGRVPIF